MNKQEGQEEESTNLLQNNQGERDELIQQDIVKPKENSSILGKFVQYAFSSGFFFYFGYSFHCQLSNSSDWNNCKNGSLLFWSSFARYYFFLFGALIILNDQILKSIPKLETISNKIYGVGGFICTVLVFILYFSNDQDCGALSQVVYRFYYLIFLLLIVGLIVGSCCFLIPGIVMLLAALVGGTNMNQNKKKQPQQQNQQQ